MTYDKTRTLQTLVCSLLLTGCSETKQGEFYDVSKIVETRVTQPWTSYQEANEDTVVSDKILLILDKELTPDGAVLSAILQNAHIKVSFEEMGISQLDMIQGGLLDISIFVRGIPSGDEEEVQVAQTFQVEEDFLNVLEPLMKKKMYKGEFEKAKLRISKEVLDLSAETRSAFYKYQASIQVEYMLKEMLRSSELAVEYANMQLGSGTFRELDLVSRKVAHEQTILELYDIEAEVLASRERLAFLMGFWGKDLNMKAVGSLPRIPDSEEELEDLENLAVVKRVELLASKEKAETLANSLSQSIEWEWVTPRKKEALLTEAGINKSTIGEKYSTQAVSLRKSKQRAEALAMEIRTEVRMAQGRLMIARKRAEHYQTNLLPWYKKVLVLSERDYNPMSLGLYKLLKSKQDQAEVFRKSIEVIRDYWIAKSDLERVVGGKIHEASSVSIHQIIPESHAADSSKLIHKNQG
ncbi:MAG: cobalt-zinc-cadmium efflux system outer membrane protein [Chlamydiales bacterium]|jgi:cobalt-zinc-cadmium efflux system outer membrane protein